MKNVLLLFQSSTVFQSGFWSQFWASTALEKVLQTFGVLAFGWLVKYVIGELETLRKIHSKFSLTGIWIGTCKLPSYPPPVEAIEIYRLVVKREDVTLKFFNYRPDVPVVKYKGTGICRGTMFSAFYYVSDKLSFESGVLVLRLSGLKLRGVYAQYDPRADEKLLVSPRQQFELMRIQMPFRARVRMRFGRQPCDTYSEVQKLYTEALADYPAAKSLSKPQRKNPPLAAVAGPPP